jgi:hypothetical protein
MTTTPPRRLLGSEIFISKIFGKQGVSKGKQVKNNRSKKIFDLQNFHLKNFR